VHHHALGEQAGERLVETDMAGRLHGAGEEAAVEQVQDGMLNAADILIDRQPAIDLGAVGRRGVDPRIGEARKIPGRVHEGVHGIGLARGWLAAARAGHVLPGRMAVERIARPLEVDVVRQRDGQIARRHRHDAAGLAVDDRDRAAPVALARDAPVAQAVIDLALSDRLAIALLALEALRHLFLRLLDGHAVEERELIMRPSPS